MSTNNYPNVSALATAVDAEVKSLQQVMPHMQCLDTNVTALKGALPTGTLLTQQLTDINTLFQTVQEIFGFLDDIKALDGVFSGAQTTIADQQKQCSEISSELATLNTTVTDIGTTVVEAEKNAPTGAAISSAVATLTSWSQGATSLTNVFDNLSSLATTANQKTQLASLVQAFDSGCADLTTRVTTLNSVTTSILNTTHDINEQLNNFATALTPIASNSLLIASSAMPVVNKMASKMKYINAILNPISLVLTVSGCTDASSKTTASVATDATKSQATSLASQTAQEVNSLIETFVNITSTGYLPLQPLFQDVTSASKTMDSSVVSALQTQFSSLNTNLQSLSQSLAAKYSYSANGKTYKNQFLSSANITAMNSLLSELSGTT